MRSPGGFRAVAKGAWAFVRRPALILPPPSGSPFAFVGRIAALDLMLRLLCTPLVLLGQRLLGGAENSLTDLDTTGISKTGLVILAVVIAPITEEAAMRLQLHPWSERRFLGATLFWLALMGLAASPSSATYWLAVSFPLILLAWRALRWVRREPVAQGWNRNPARVLWFLTLGFGLSHIANYDINISDWRLVFAVLLIVPQIIGGLLIAYTRVRLGYWAGVAHHALGNAVLIALVLPSL